MAEYSHPQRTFGVDGSEGRRKKTKGEWGTVSFVDSYGSPLEVEVEERA